MDYVLEHIDEWYNMARLAFWLISKAAPLLTGPPKLKAKFNRVSH